MPVYLPNRQGCLFYHCATIRFEDDTDKIKHEEFVLSPEDRLEASFEIAKVAFKKSDFSLQDIENAIIVIRRKNCEKKKKDCY